MSQFASISGYIGLTFAILMFLPQVIKVVIRKKTDDLSKPTFTINTIGVFFWMIYGSLIAQEASLQAWAANFANSLFLIVIIWYLFNNKIRITFIIFTFIVIIISISFIIWPINISNAGKLSFVIIGGSMTGIAFYPQVIKIVITKKTKDLSIITPILIFLATSFYQIYWIEYIIANNISVNGIFASIFNALLCLSQITILVVMVYNKVKNNSLQSKGKHH